MKDGKHAGGHEYVVARRDQGSDAVLPLEPEGDVDRDEYDGEDGREHAVVEEFVTDQWAYNFVATEGVTRPQLRLDRIRHCFADLRGIRLDTNEDTGIDWRVALSTTEILDVHFLEAERIDVCAHLGDVDDLGGLDLHEDAAREVDAQIEALQRDRNHRHQHQKPVHRKRIVAPADEIDICGFGNESQEGHRKSGSVRQT